MKKQMLGKIGDLYKVVSEVIFRTGSTQDDPERIIAKDVQTDLPEFCQELRLINKNQEDEPLQSNKQKPLDKQTALPLYEVVSIEVIPQ